MSTRGTHTRARRARGAATVEAVIALPVLVLVLLGVHLVERRALVRHATLADARACAWAHAASGCRAWPTGCAGERRGASRSPGAGPPPEVERALSSGEVQALGLSRLPFLSGALAGGSAVVTSERAVKGAGTDGQETVRATARVVSPCNERVEDEDVVSGVFRAVTRPFLGGR